MMDKKKTGNDYRLQLAVLAGIGIILLCILGFMGAETWIQYRDALINAQKDQMLLTVETLSRDMSDAFKDKAADLAAMRAGPGFTWIFWRAEATTWTT